MAALLPLLAMGIPALLSGVSGIMGIANEAKKLHGGRLRHYRRKGKGIKHRPHLHVGRRKRGRGVAANIIGSIPLLGNILGPIVSALGGRVRRRGHGLSPMYYSRPYVGMGLSPLGKMMASQYRSSANGSFAHGFNLPKSLGMTNFGKILRSAYGTGMKRKRAHVMKHKRKMHHKRGYGISPMYYGRPYVGMGLLAPAGGHLRKGHLRKIHGRAARVRVAPALIHHGGYKSYQFRPRHYMIKM